MKFSIITVAYNSAEHIASTLESVMEGCRADEPEMPVPEVEYLIIDGKSSDDTVRIAECYRDRMESRGICYRIVSEPDNGIYDAMNKGIRLASGDFIGFINAGDRYTAGAFAAAWDTIRRTDCDIVFGNIRVHKTDGSSFIKMARIRKFQTSRDWNHPTMFVKRELYQTYPFRCMGIHDDYGFYLQMQKLQVKIVTTDWILADFYMGGVSNSKSIKKSVERIRDRYRYCYRINGYSRWYLLECLFIEGAKWFFG